MFVTPSKSPAKNRAAKWKIFCFPIITSVFCAAASWAQAPSVVVDAQQTIGYGYSNPQAIAVSKNGTIYVADTNNNQIIALENLAPQNGVSNKVSTGAFVLSTPQALALDANGDLFVGDSPVSGGQTSGRIIELLGDGNGNLTGAASLVFAGAPLTNPISMTVSVNGELFVGDYNENVSPAVGTMYYMNAAAPATPILVNVTGLPSTFIPAALATGPTADEIGTVLYFADNGSFNGGVYSLTSWSGGGSATPINTGSFVINQPSGLAFGPSGGLYVLSLLGTGSGYNPGQQVVVLGATPYILPNTGIGTSSSMAFDVNGNLDVLDSADGAVIQLSSANPVNLGNANVGKTGSQVLFNFEFNAPTTIGGFRSVTQGDVSSELIRGAGGTCANGTHTNLPGRGPAISNYYPYSCKEYYYGDPTYPGIRSSAIQVKGSGTAILASTPVYQTGFAGVEVTYPLNETTTAIGLQQPQAIAVSGLNKTVYIADTLAGKVYSTGGLGGSALTPVSTGTLSLSAPSALALDGAGNLFIADFDNAQVIEVPTTTGAAPSVVNTGRLLQHPIALAFDYIGNLYIGDAGPGGVNASAGVPGFVVKVPAAGIAAPSFLYAFQMTIPSVSIIFPQALATDPYTAALLIGDGGDATLGVGQVVQVSADGTSAGTGPVAGVTNPTGLAFDQAEDLYILDGNANTITVVPGPQLPNGQFLLQFDNTTLSAASALGISAGGQSFVIANIGSGSSNSLVYLNGNASTLPFGNVKVGTQSQPLTATEYNIGNLILDLKSPYYKTNGGNGSFSVLGSSTCGNGMQLYPSTSCSINVEFKPRATGQTTEKINVESDGYNSGVPTLTLQGTGTRN